MVDVIMSVIVFVAVVLLVHGMAGTTGFKQ